METSQSFHLWSWRQRGHHTQRRPRPEGAFAASVTDTCSAVCTEAACRARLSTWLQEHLPREQRQEERACEWTLNSDMRGLGTSSLQQQVAHQCRGDGSQAPLFQSRLDTEWNPLLPTASVASPHVHCLTLVAWPPIPCPTTELGVATPSTKGG